MPYSFDIGAIVVATGYDLYDQERLGEYGGGRYPDVIDGLQFEEMLRPDGPTGGQIRRPSDGKVPKEVVWVQCAGSRDPELHMPYCSKVCCMYVAKQIIALQAAGAGWPGHRLLHRHPQPGQGLRGVCPAGDGRV